MQKISSILPANARVTTVDMKASGASRSGMPSWGREVGVTAAAEKKMQQEASAKAINQHNELMQHRKENADPNVKIVTELADKFFNSRLEKPTEEIALEFDSNSDLVPHTASPLGTENEDDFLVVGQYLDVKA